MISPIHSRFAMQQLDATKWGTSITPSSRWLVIPSLPTLHLHSKWQLVCTVKHFHDNKRK